MHVQTPTWSKVTSLVFATSSSCRLPFSFSTVVLLLCSASLLESILSCRECSAFERGKNIPPHHIISISARWGLRFREWSLNAPVLLEHESARDTYDEAIILLQRAGYEDKVRPMEGKRNEAAVTHMSHYLEEFSHNVGNRGGPRG